MRINFTYNMKKHISKIALLAFMTISLCCLFYVNNLESQSDYIDTQYGEFAQTSEKVITHAKTATAVFERVIDFLTKREA